MMDGEFSREVQYEIIEHIGIVNEGKEGWRRELNLISWNGKPPKYDIRCWTEGREHFSRAVTLYPMEMEHVIKLVERHMGIVE